MQGNRNRKTDETAIYKTGSPIYVWVSQDIKDKITSLADANGQTISIVVRNILDSYFNQ